MKNFKNRNEFIKESVELSEQELEQKKKPNWKFVNDLIPEGESEPLVNKGDSVYYDEAGERLVIVDGGNQGMIVDLTLGDMERHAIKLWSGGGFDKETFPAYKVANVDGEPGDAEKLAEYIEDFHDISFDMGVGSENLTYYSKGWLDKNGTPAKKFRAIVEEEAKRLDMNVHVSIVRLFDDGEDTKEV